MSPVLALDIGGTYLKAALLDQDGEMLSDALRAPTPVRTPPVSMLNAIENLVTQLGTFDRISIGFPGALRRNVILTAPNLGTEFWRGVDLAQLIANHFNRPTRLANDATMHGLGVIEGDGIEVVMTLGTGMGFALFREGLPAPQIELGQHTAGDSPSYDSFVGDAAFRTLGVDPWKQHVYTAISRCAALVNFDKLYLGGGNARHFTQAELPDRVQLALNAAGLKGGIKLWQPQMDLTYR